ncbi:signal peptidase I [Embleya scabrispora]|uniref:Signal peptidase I n=2 Tax=Embleya scabrispora TaxID=159449 RepID=A0A1T3NL40_9ACTN|nr:signal peptidase I [Embleya scabrispora]
MVGSAVVATVILVLAGARALRSRLALVRVTGTSMAPTFADGDRVLVDCAAPVRRGDVVVFRNPTAALGADRDPRWLVKRVAAVPGDPVPVEMRDVVRAPNDGVVPAGSLVVRGDAPRSHDSRHFGYVPASTVLGVVGAGPRIPWPVARGRWRRPDRSANTRPHTAPLPRAGQSPGR